MEIQTSNRVLMIRPATFYFNEETAEDNSFQGAPPKSSDKSEIHRKAVAEFDALVNLLKSAGVTVEVIEEDPEPYTSDSVFPNNWLSYHFEQSDAIGVSSISQENNAVIEEITPIIESTAILYPMWSNNRRPEREKNKVKALQLLPENTVVLDLSPLEKSGRFLEGTGSLVLDRCNRIAYACLSSRTTKDAVELFCRRMGYKPMSFNATDPAGRPCYHTNVMMSIADKYCIVCLDAIPDLGERVEVEVSLKNSGKVVIPLSLRQMNNFAGNCLQLRGKDGTFLVMSSRAFSSLTEEQADMIRQFDKVLHSDVATIENIGGGSVRCMIAELGDTENKQCRCRSN